MSPTVSVYLLGLQNSFRGEALLRELHSTFSDVRIHWGIDARVNPMDHSLRNDSRSMRIYGRVLRDSEIACAQGHFQILLQAKRNPTDITLILEDDAEVLDSSQLMAWLKELDLHKPKIWTFPNETSPKLVIPTPFKKVSKKTFCTPTLAHAYAVNELALDLVLYGYTRYGFEGFQADFPLFYADSVNFEIAPMKIIQQSNVESLIGKRLAGKKPKYGTSAIRAILVLSSINWFLGGYQDSKMRGYLYFYHGRKLHKYIAHLQKRIKLSSRSPG